MKLLSVAGARPNFMKIASIARAVNEFNTSNNLNNKIEHLIVHTGQHYDKAMSTSFFDELNIPKPNINLDVGSASHAVQTANIMKKFEKVLLDEMPDVVLVVGDVNSTIACTLVASKIVYPTKQNQSRPLIVHVEAGLRSYDITMPEEINRILTDTISDVLFVTEKSGITNLEKEGVSSDKIFFVGNVMIDTLKQHLEKASNSHIKEELNISEPYGIVTLHRPSNVDNKELFKKLIEHIETVSKKLHLIFPVHPRTAPKLKKLGLFTELKKISKSTNKRITFTNPLGYLDFLNLLKNAKLVLTDSGGIQEETTFLDVPCITLRENTERPVTVTQGSNYLIGSDINKIIPTVDNILTGKGKKSTIPDLWDGNSGKRIVEMLVKQLILR